MNEYHSKLHNLIKLLTVCFVLYFTLTSVCLAGNPTTINESADLQITLSMEKESGDDQYGAAGNALNEPFVVKVADKNGNGVAGASITLSIENQPEGASGAALLEAPDETPTVFNTTTNSDGIAETILKFGDSTGEYIVSATATDDEVESGTIQIFAAYAENIEIRKVWSDQFPGFVANFLPPTGHNNGSGKNTNFILMGVRDDGQHYRGFAKAEIVINPDITSRERVLVRLALLKNGRIDKIPDRSRGTIVENGVIVASMSTLMEPSIFGDRIDDYIVVAGIDANNNGELDLQEITSDKIGYRFKIISKARYDFSRDYFNTVTSSYFILPHARNFLRSFTNNSVPGGADKYSEDIILANTHNLSHRVGIELLDDNTGRIKKYVFPSNSDLSSKIRSHPNFLTLLQQTVENNRDQILEHFRNYPVNEQEFEPWDLIASSIHFDLLTGTGPDAYYCDDSEGKTTSLCDLYYAFGKADFENVKVIAKVKRDADNNVDLVSVSIIGNLKDLYDWDYGDSVNVFFDPHGAAIQAGYSTLGNGGQVFRVIVKLDQNDIPFSLFIGNIDN